MAVVIAIGIVIALSALIPSRGEQAANADYQSKRALGNPYSISHVWKVDRKADLVEMARALSDRGLALRQERDSPNEVILRGGSQLWTRLFGGYFVSPKRLPIEVKLKTANGVKSGKWTVQLGIRDKLGTAVRDEALEDRFALAAGDIRDAIESQLVALGGVEIDAAL